MNEKMEAALEASIEKWKERAEMHQKGVWPVYPYASKCPLCIEAKKQTAATALHHCTICPVFKKTKKNACRETPYIIYTQAYDDVPMDFQTSFSEQIAKFAMDEADFLESLKEP